MVILIDCDEHFQARDGEEDDAEAEVELCNRGSVGTDEGGVGRMNLGVDIV